MMFETEASDESALASPELVERSIPRKSSDRKLFPRGYNFFRRGTLPRTFSVPPQSWQFSNLIVPLNVGRETQRNTVIANFSDGDIIAYHHFFAFPSAISFFFVDSLPITINQ
jgi:hypothetical protein